MIDPYVGTLQLSLREAANRSLPTTRYVTPSVESTSPIPPVDAVAGSKSVLQALMNEGAYATGVDGRTVIAALAAAYVSDEQGNRAVMLDDRLLFEREFPWA